MSMMGIAGKANGQSPTEPGPDHVRQGAMLLACLILVVVAGTAALLLVQVSDQQAVDTARWLAGTSIVAATGAVLLLYWLLVRARRQVRSLMHDKHRLMNANAVLEHHIQDHARALDEAQEHLDQERRRAEALLQEASHRIGNSLTTVSSLLGLQLLRSSTDEVQAALEAARSRVHAIAAAHRRLRLGRDNEAASADEFLDAVLEDMALTAGDIGSVRLTGEFDPIAVSGRDATTLGILVGELVTNAVKHGFPGDRRGSIVVSLKRDSAGMPELKVQDDGVGIAKGQSLGDGGLGSVIVRQLSAQFGGEPRYERRSSGGLSVTIPLPGIELGAQDGRR